jgi:hypothetical protein
VSRLPQVHSENHKESDKTCNERNKWLDLITPMHLSEQEQVIRVSKAARSASDGADNFRATEIFHQKVLLQ